MSKSAVNLWRKNPLLECAEFGRNIVIYDKDKALFDENVIVDLSRVGSAETKSLIMGMLVLKLQELRMTDGNMHADYDYSDLSNRTYDF